jgi:poly-gamma-glutamate synthesis protein (capsule biosynthesis protein)
VVHILPEESLLEAAWNMRDAVAILPFESLGPRWKVLPIDNQSPLKKGFDSQSYPLTVPVALQVNRPLPESFDLQTLQIPQTNYTADRLSSIALTGVTALVRGTAFTMDARGITYPAELIQPWLTEVDILHINNEIPFYSDCPPAELYPTEIRFCSPPTYKDLLTYIGTDVIELAGDHFGDYGSPAMLETLALYQKLGIPYYGGGANSLEARQAVLLEHNGNRFAFIGCNAKGIDYYASADETSPGAVACDFDWLIPEITRLTNAGYLVIATFQHNEYYTYEAQPDLVRDFKRVAQAGAVIVSGSQAHQPHGMAFEQDSFLHYGLGNLFFDQYRYFLDLSWTGLSSINTTSTPVVILARSCWSFNSLIWRAHARLNRMKEKPF